MNQTTVDESVCTRCGACVFVCPAGIVRPHKRTGLPMLRRALESMCIQCGHCVAVCPVDALSHSALEMERAPSAVFGEAHHAASVHEVLRGRRSIRAYRDEPVARECVERLLAAASHGPSACNRQPVEWVVVLGRERVRALAELIVEGARESGSMPFVVSTWDAGQDPALRGAPCVVVAHASAGTESMDSCSPTDCAIAVSSLEIAATSEGLGCCWAGFLMMASSHPAVREFLEIPAGRAVFGALMLGHPAYSYKRVPKRKAPRVKWLTREG